METFGKVSQAFEYTKTSRASAHSRLTPFEQLWYRDGHGQAETSHEVFDGSTPPHVVDKSQKGGTGGWLWQTYDESMLLEQQAWQR